LASSGAAQSPPGAVVFATTPIPLAVREAALDLKAVERLGWGVAMCSRPTSPKPCTIGLSMPGANRHAPGMVHWSDLRVV
jgi:hypothetical protein